MSKQPLSLGPKVFLAATHVGRAGHSDANKAPPNQLTLESDRRLISGGRHGGESLIPPFVHLLSLPAYTRNAATVKVTSFHPGQNLVSPLSFFLSCLELLFCGVRIFYHTTIGDSHYKQRWYDTICARLNETLQFIYSNLT